MTFEQSIEVLGLGERLAAREKGPLTQTELRAAYVALIKVHKPERDPEGFKRVREAYEAAQQGLRWHEQGLAFAAEPEAAAPPSGLEASADVLPLNEAENAERAREEAAFAAEDAAIDAAYQRIDAANDDATRMELLRKAIVDFPREDSFRWQLVDLYDQTHQRSRADALIEEGVAQGLPGFLETYAQDAPERITEAQLEQLRQKHTTLVLLRVAIAQKREPLFREVLQQAMETGQRKQPRMPYIDLALFALEREDLAAAERVLGALKEHDSQFAVEPRAQVAELLTRDVIMLRDGLPHTYVRAFIEGIRLGRPNPEVTALRAKDPARAREVRDLLRGHSAALSKLYEPLLAPSAETPPPPAPAKSNWNWSWVLIASVVLRACMAAVRNSDSHATSSYEVQRALDRAERIRLEQEASRPTGAVLGEESARDSYAYESAVVEPETRSAEETFTDAQVHDAVMVICQEANAFCAAAEALERACAEDRCELMQAMEFGQDTQGHSPAAELELVRDAAFSECALHTDGASTVP